MATPAEPIIGKWYRAPASGETFEVLGVNEDADLVEVRYLGRGRRMLNRDGWQALRPVRVAPPSDEDPADAARATPAPDRH